MNEDGMLLRYDEEAGCWKEAASYATLEIETEEDLNFLKEGTRTLGVVRSCGYSCIEDLFQDVLKICEGALFPNYKEANLAQDLKENMERFLNLAK